jgi:uncharacterized Ntn-hydrolase superfamily protein
VSDSTLAAAGRLSPEVATYSICACDLDAGQWGVATQSKFLAVGSVVPWAAPHVGAIATQAYANPRYGPDGLELLRGGATADEVVALLTEADSDAAIRQLGVVDGAGGAATFTGTECHSWAGGATGGGYAVQGNILVSEDTIVAMSAVFESSAGQPLAERLLACLDAAESAGGDSRGRQAAALLVVERDGGYAGLSDTLVDLRIDDHADPVVELRRLFAIHTALFGSTPRSEWLMVENALRGEIDEWLGRLGFRSLADWAGVENLEERVDGEDMIDPVVLDVLRERSA